MTSTNFYANQFQVIKHELDITSNSTLNFKLYTKDTTGGVNVPNFDNWFDFKFYDSNSNLVPTQQNGNNSIDVELNENGKYSFEFEGKHPDPSYTYIIVMSENSNKDEENLEGLLDLSFDDSLGNVQTIDGEIVLSTAKGAVSFSTLEKAITFSGMKHPEGSYVKKDLPNGRYKLTYVVTKKDENASDTIYISTKQGGKPDVISISTNVELNTEYEYEYEIKERFFAVSVMDSYDKNGTTEVKIIRLQQLEIFAEDLPVVMGENETVINIQGELKSHRIVKHFELTLTAWYNGKLTSPEIDAISQTTYENAEKWQKLSNNLNFQIRLDKDNPMRYASTDVKMSGTSGGIEYVKAIKPGKYILVVDNNSYHTIQNINFKLQIYRPIEIVEINGAEYEAVTETSYVKLKF